MKEKIKLISLPTQANFCALICATVKNDFSILSAKVYYRVENEKGIRFCVYARNHSDFYRKYIAILEGKDISLTIPSNLEHNNIRQMPKINLKDDE